MAELLVRVVGDTSANPFVNANAFKRGDVAVAFADGHAWGCEELTDPRWRILRFPGATLDDASVLLSPEKAATRQSDRAPDPMLQIRGFALKLDTGDAALDAFLADASRRQAVFVMPVPLASLVVRKPPLKNPNVIG